MIKEVTTNWVKNEYVEDETALIFIESKCQVVVEVHWYW